MNQLVPQGFDESVEVDVRVSQFLDARYVVEMEHEVYRKVIERFKKLREIVGVVQRSNARTLRVVKVLRAGRTSGNAWL